MKVLEGLGLKMADIMEKATLKFQMVGVPIEIGKYLRHTHDSIFFSVPLLTRVFIVTLMVNFLSSQ